MMAEVTDNICSTAGAPAVFNWCTAVKCQAIKAPITWSRKTQDTGVGIGIVAETPFPLESVRG